MHARVSSLQLLVMAFVSTACLSCYPDDITSDRWDIGGGLGADGEIGDAGDATHELESGDVAPQRTKDRIYYVQREDDSRAIDDPEDVFFKEREFVYPEWSSLPRLHGLDIGAGFLPAFVTPFEVLLQRHRRTMKSWRLGVVEGFVERGKVSIDIGRASIQPCLSAREFDYKIAPRRGDRCVYVGGQLMTDFELEERSDSKSEPGDTYHLKVGGGDGESYSCAFQFPDELGSYNQTSYPFRMPLTGSNSERDDGVDVKCSDGDGEELQLTGGSGWFSGERTPGVSVTSLSAQFELEGVDFAVWARLARESPFEPYDRR